MVYAAPTVRVTAIATSQQFQERNNIHPIETTERMATMTARTVEKHMPYASPIGPERTRLMGI